MAFTLTCRVCGQKLHLFDIDVKKRKGTVRCNRCGAKIAYDLDQRKIQQSGFWATEEPAFDARAKNRLMNQIQREEARKSAQATAAPAHDFGENPFAAKAGFAKFDLKTGEIVNADTAKPAAPVSAETKREGVTFRVVDKSHQKRTIRAARNSVPSMKRQEKNETPEKTFTPPPKVVTRSAHRNVKLARQPQKPRTETKPIQISRIQSFWQKVKNFFHLGRK